MRTRVGYAGGTTGSPTYRSIGNHTETVQVDFDSSRISYAELLEQFWQGHDATTPSWSRQYASLIMYHDERQREEAQESKKAAEKRTGSRLFTEIIAAGSFTRAEEYHQKYRLQGYADFMDMLRQSYPAFRDLVDSTAAARLNGYLDGYGTGGQLRSEIHLLGLSDRLAEKLIGLHAKSRRPGARCPI